ncbi:MAG: methyltransferase, partial [Alkalimonas sp.]|nr:methyltransferase [Alkalimonas sp.]
MTAGFQCKQFFIGHQYCAMKVGTDAMLLGAWAQLPTQGAVLDIGCGSGILSLMLAQRSQGQLSIHALDLDEGAVLQTQLNVQTSPWPSAIQVLRRDILTYQPA